jgi:hypothetical protein
MGLAVASELPHVANVRGVLPAPDDPARSENHQLHAAEHDRIPLAAHLVGVDDLGRPSVAEADLVGRHRVEHPSSACLDPRPGATFGRHAIEWSPGLRARLLPDDRELTDREIAEAEVGGVDACVLPAKTWDAVVEQDLEIAVLETC